MLGPIRFGQILMTAVLVLVLAAALLWVNQEVSKILNARSGGSCGVGDFTKGADGVCVPVATPSR